MKSESLRLCRITMLSYIVLTFGCAFNLADVTYQPARIKVAGNEETSFVLATETPIQGAPCGYSRSLRKDTRWNPAGRIAEGIVYRSPDQSLTIECSNIFEAYLVVSGQKLVGFYLPVEKGFSSLDKPIELTFSDQR
jgi:hypothetical protein